MAIIQFVAPDQGVDLSMAASKFRDTLAAMNANLFDEVSTPAQLSTNITALVAGEQADGTGGLSVLGGIRALRKLFQYGREAKQLVQATQSRIRLLANREALTAFVRRTAIIEAARNIRAVNPETYDEAIALRDELAGVLEEEASLTTDDTVFSTLMDLRAGVVQDLTTRATPLARLETQTPTYVSNSLAMAYDLYEDATRERELADRNGLALPGFIPAEPLQVLNQ